MNSDTRRLDFIIDNVPYISLSPSSPRGVCVWDQSNGLEVIGKGKTAREAIDDAIANLERKNK